MTNIITVILWPLAGFIGFVLLWISFNQTVYKEWKRPITIGTILIGIISLFGGYIILFSGCFLWIMDYIHAPNKMDPLTKLIDYKVYSFKEKDDRQKTGHDS